MNEPSDKEIQRIAELIHRHRSFLVSTHVRPDGDAVGALLALVFMLRRLGKRADPYCQDPSPACYEFLAGAETISTELPRPGVYEVAVLVDCGDLERVGPALAPAIRTVPLTINIDHHSKNDTPFGTVSWVKPGASSTCEMLYDLSPALPVSLDDEIATHLYTGLMTDTGSFRFSNTTRRVLEIATALVAAGADPARIAQEVYDSASPQGLKLLAQVLSSVVFLSGDRLATMVLTQRMFQETGTTPEDTEGFINYIRSVKPVHLAMLFRQERNGMIHVSMRSKGRVDVAALARRYGGGGHRHAAAFRVAGSLDRVRETFTDAALEYLDGIEG
ncbi:MAG TPA: bifunctional oligoribonuclease/PAP phosphatase NrnA [Syntrophobacteraceae bacterium]|nr:bifunctional oligoribonuclease/PAP phosphatase NrnA [Syntrophobacteraceae bacterium]